MPMASSFRLALGPDAVDLGAPQGHTRGDEIRAG